MDQIEVEFQEKAVIRGGLFLFKPVDALELIDRCLQLKRPILGIDAFRIADQVIQPVLEHSVDFSNKEGREGFWQEAKEFIQHKLNKELVFEVVYKSSH